MTYLELVNAVLVRLREDTITSVSGSDDVVVNLVKEFVNDAKKVVEESHAWTALSTEWEQSSTIGDEYLVLTDSARHVIIDYIYDSEGNKLKLSDKESLRRKALQLSTNNTPTKYIVDGKDSVGDLRLRVCPTPKEVKTYTIFGYQSTPALSEDTDRLVVPSQPVIYTAQALAARERGEVGGQSPSELMAIAKQSLSDAIATDSTNSDLNNIWYSV